LDVDRLKTLKTAFFAGFGPPDNKKASPELAPKTGLHQKQVGMPLALFVVFGR
jgi:hypothetical protein